MVLVCGTHQLYEHILDLCEQLDLIQFLKGSGMIWEVTWARFSPVGASPLSPGSRDDESSCETVRRFGSDGRSAGQQMSQSTTLLKVVFFQPDASLTPLKLAIFSGQCTCTYLLRWPPRPHALHIFMFWLQLFQNWKLSDEEAKRLQELYTNNAFFSFFFSIHFLIYFETRRSFPIASCLIRQTLKKEIPCLIL